jgi:hypothetical protein
MKYAAEEDVALVWDGCHAVQPTVRVGYQSVGWGGYIHLDIVNPWKR